MLYDALIDTGTELQSMVFPSSGQTWRDITSDALRYVTYNYSEHRKVSIVHIGKYIHLRGHSYENYD